MKANKDYLAYALQEDTAWNFVVPIESESLSGLYEETISLIGHSYEAFTGFMSPLAVECVIGAVERDRTVDELATLSFSDYNVTRLTASSENGLGYDELAKEIQDPNEISSPHRQIKFVQFKDVEVSVILSGGEQRVGKVSNLYKARGDVDAPPETPIEMTIQTYCDHSPPNHSITVSLNTDIWFEDTEIGAANRQRLQEFLERMADVLDATEVDYWSNSHAIPFEIE